MRILYHHRTLGDGAEGIHIKEMVKAFRDLDHQVKVIGPTGETYSKSLKKSKILSKLKQSIPYIFYEVLEISYTGYCFFKTSWEIWSYRPDFIYDRYITFNAGVVLAGRVLKIPVFLEVNAPLAMERSVQEDEKLILKKIASYLEKWVCTNATQTIVVSTPLKQYLESIGVPAGKCIVMPNGANPQHFVPKPLAKNQHQQLGIPENVFIIGFTGVLRPWHGLELLILAASNLINKRQFKVFLLIVGDGPFREQLDKIIRNKGLEKSVLITGRVSHQQVPEYVNLFDVAVSPRATFYASPMKVIEYMALGKPVVVPGTLNFLDIIEDGVQGITFKDGDIDALEEALAQLYLSPELRHILGVRAREKVELRLNWQWNAREVCGWLIKAHKRF